MHCAHFLFCTLVVLIHTQIRALPHHAFVELTERCVRLLDVSRISVVVHDMLNAFFFLCFRAIRQGD